MRKIPDEDFPAYFWSRIEILDNESCWGWKKSLRTAGYGRVYFHRKCFNASRLAYILTYGEINQDVEVCHECDNKKCCNPHHLFLGTHKENMDDAWNKGIIKPPPVAYGTRNTSSKLTEDKVKQIFKLYKSGITKSDIARNFGITKQAVGLVLKRVNWAWVNIGDNNV